MTPLWRRFEEALLTDSGDSIVKAGLSWATLEWIGDRLVCDDVVAALREVLPNASEEELLAAVAAVGRVLGEP